MEGTSGSGVTLDGSSGQIVASQPITNPTTYSEEMWFKTTTDNGGLLTGFGSSPSGMSDERDRLVWMSNNGQLNFGVYNATAEQTVVVQSAQSYNDGNWHHVVATQGSDGMNLYVDGQLVGSNANGQAQSYLGYWRVGAENLSGWPNSPSSNYFAGTISDVAFYNSELSAGQVLTHYQASGVALPDRLDLLGHRGRPSPRPAVADRLDLVGQRWWWRHLGDVRRLPVRQPDLGR